MLLLIMFSSKPVYASSCCLCTTQQKYATTKAQASRRRGRKHQVLAGYPVLSCPLLSSENKVYDTASTHFSHSLFFVWRFIFNMPARYCLPVVDLTLTDSKIMYMKGWKNWKELKAAIHVIPQHCLIMMKTKETRGGNTLLIQKILNNTFLKDTFCETKMVYAIAA